MHRPLKSDHHIRLLEVVTADDRLDVSYRIVQRDLHHDDEHPFFEAVSYTWADPLRVATLPVDGESGSIGLTKNLSQALPCLAKRSNTKLLWIDQICINQADPTEKAKQVAMMAKIYKSAARVLVWLGPADENTRLCKQFLGALDTMFRGMPNSDRMIPETTTFNPDFRFLIARSTFTNPESSPIYAPAIKEFWARPWFCRGWIVQELLLARDVLFLSGHIELSMQDLADLMSAPPDKAPRAEENEPICSQLLMNLKMEPIKEEQPLKFLRLMAQVSQEFQTTEPADRLYAFLGMIDGSTFVPDYSLPIRENYTKFAASLARDFGSLDFLALCSANLDELLATTVDFERFPSWVPSWTAIPLSAPFRLAAGGVRTFRSVVSWNAAGGRQHVHDEMSEPARAGRLIVRGKIVDAVDAFSNARIARHHDADEDYLDGLVRQICNDLSPDLTSWTLKDMVHFLNVVSANGNLPAETTEEVLGVQQKQWGDELKNMSGYRGSLAACLAMAYGRRFMRTTDGRIGLSPWIGTTCHTREKKGSVIAILHGCIVPIMLNIANEDRNEYMVIGDCYVQGIMHGEAVSWAEEDSQAIVLI
ncbi:heterokaryon incompatibility protein [Corynespora cassiicola Philippines]|uniref:Heterokaryon incompatibility protein n=1 Tax=Corynespora cassiicola Philippines TaxID=1448308 RepID=A0A2T2N6V9_CORCC|nr:heterokaryon incompatibility protein [Corynespora cassiicola Philippines]